MKPGRLTRTILLIALLLTACSDKQQSIKDHLSTAKYYLDKSEYNKARIELKNVLQIDPRNASAYNYLGKLEEKRQEWRSAYLYYQKATELDPKQLNAQVRIGHFLLQQATRLKDHEKSNMLGRVKDQINTVLKYDSKNLDGLLLKAALDTQLERYPEAVLEIEYILEEEPSNTKAILLLERIYETTNKPGKAQQVLENGIKDNPKNIELHLHAAGFYARKNKSNLAIYTLQRLINAYPDSLEYRLKLATYYMKLKRDEDAQTTYQQAIKEIPNDIRSHLALAKYTEVKKGPNEAIKILQSAIQILPDEPGLLFALAVVHKNSGTTDKSIKILNELINKHDISRLGIMARKELASIYATRGDTHKVTELTNQILYENRNDSDALLISGKNALLIKDYETAISNFNSILKYQPDSIQVLLLLAETYQRQRNITLAEDTLKSILKLDPDNTEAHIGLARFYLAERKDNLASKHIKTVLVNNPKNLPALILASEMLAINSNIKALVPVLNKIKQVAPDSPEGWFRTGRMYLALKDYKSAHDEILIAWKKETDSIDLLAELIDIEIMLRDFDSSIERLKYILKNNPNHKTAHKFLGMVYLASKNTHEAEKEFILQINNLPDDILAHMELAKLYNLEGDFDDAARYYQKALNYAPNDLHLKFGLASTRELQHKYDEAITLYDEILVEKPNDAVVINNLAMLLANHKTDETSLKRAQTLAEKFIGNIEPIYLDTLGWVYYKTGEYDKAVPPLEHAIRQAPNVAVFQYHLGLVHIKKGNNNIAKELLQNAVNAKYFPGKKDAEKQLKSLD